MCVGGRWGELFTCPYPLKVQARPPRDQTPAIRSRVSGQEREVQVSFVCNSDLLPHVTC